MVSVKKEDNVTEKSIKMNQIGTVRDKNKNIEFVLNSVKADFQRKRKLGKIAMGMIDNKLSSSKVEAQINLKGFSISSAQLRLAQTGLNPLCCYGFVWDCINFGWFGVDFGP